MTRRALRRLLPALTLLLVAAAPVRALDLASAVGRPVLRVDVENRSRIPNEEVLRLFQVRAGDRYDADAVQRSLELLAQKVGIRNVGLTGSEEGGGLVLRLEVAPDPLVRSIHFSGNHAVKDRDLASRMQIRVDRPAYGPFLESDARTIRDLYIETGFPDARVTSEIGETSDPFWVKVTYRIQEGEPDRIARVELSGGGPLDRERTLGVLGVQEGSRASPREFRERVRRLMGVYHQEGYPEARAPLARFEKRGSETILVLPVLAGSPVDIRFEGIEESSMRPLREALETRFGETVDDIWTTQAASLLVETLAARGHRNARVVGELAREGVRKLVTFRVDAGPVARVDRVSFNGNDSAPAAKLQTYMSVVESGFLRRPPVTQDGLDRDLKALADYYASQGFLDASVTLSGVEVDDSGRAHVRIEIREGKAYLLDQVSFAGGGLEEGEARKLAGLQPGKPADPGDAENARVRLLAEILKRGHPDAQVTYAWTKHPDTGTVDLSYRFQPGPLVRFGKTVVAGNARTLTHVIEREITFREGEPWNAQEVLLTRQKLFRLGYFQKVALEPLGETRADGSRDVRVEVEEQDAGSLSFGVGYGSEEGPKGFAELGHANLAGTGREVKLRAEGQDKDRTYTLSFREPWLFGQRLDLSVRLIRQIIHLPAYSNSLIALQASLDRNLTEKLHASLLYTLEGNQLTNIAQNEDVSDINNYLLSSFGPLLVWDSRDDPFNPRHGFLHTVQAEWAPKALGSEVQYGRYSGSVSGYFTWWRATLALLARGGFAENLGQAAELPANKRFYLGGRTTVRGFELDSIGPRAERSAGQTAGGEGDGGNPDQGNAGTDPGSKGLGKPLGGDTMLNLKAELRIPVWKQLGFALFWDAGNVWVRKQKLDLWNLRQGAGVGLRYITPIGPISVDLAKNLHPEEGERHYMLHFTIGNAF